MSNEPKYDVDNADNHAMPSISIEIEGFSSAEEGSPLHRYRPGGTLSVTDLISLAWCEVQFDYRMRQKRFRRSADRPLPFRAESNQEILVQLDVTAHNDEATKRGQFIHKELERELRAEEVELMITSEEEQWAIRLINFLSCLVSLRAEGRAREIPVFGIVHGVVVIGIIDELLVRDQSEPKTGTKRASDSSLPPPKRTYRGPSAPSCQPEPVPPSPTPSPQCIRLIDTKTRRTDSVPSDEDAVPAHLQVMLYHRLLSRLIDTSTPFDFSALWTLLGMRAFASFSPTFLRQAAPILGGPQPVPVCLEDIVLFVRTRLIELDLPRVDDTAQIIYLSQKKYFDRRRREETTYTPPTCEDDIVKPIQMSLDDMLGIDLAAVLKESADLAADLAAALKGSPDLAATLKESADLAAALRESTDLATDLTAALKESQDLVATLKESAGFAAALKEIAGLAAVLTESVDLTAALAESTDLTAALKVSADLAVALKESADLAAAHKASILETKPGPGNLCPAQAVTDPVPAQETAVSRPGFIRTKDFTMDKLFLDSYLQNALDWWRGKRSAEGVPPRQAGRCLSCQYMGDCEWRKTKASEKLEEAMAKLRRQSLNEKT
ncbi:hypothetical protein MSAN_01748900 [Mycena sanguinolenta]|uniref:Exonuclease V n=1 Tax=Mycena sanguinolenta TaxID=230812 RepID=A0A8H7CUK4_9AGAR|nr:hypothetical protein MSAN_01748900 [Mycena sanguinolenta]